MRVNRCIAATALLCGLSAAGCRWDPAVAQRLEYRGEGMAFGAHALSWREGAAGERLAYDGEWIRKAITRDGEQLGYDLREFRRHWQREFHRFDEQRAFGEKERERTFGGNPEAIEPTAILFL